MRKDTIPVKLNRAQIMEIIPHRDPMLLIDEVTEMYPDKKIIAKFYVSPERDIFRGHFPGAPVLPGVYTTEIMAQAADILLLSTERYAGTIPYFIGIENVKFIKKVLPGDTLEIHAMIAAENREKGIVTCSAEVYNNGELASTGVVTLGMRGRSR